MWMDVLTEVANEPAVAADGPSVLADRPAVLTGVLTDLVTKCCVIDAPQPPHGFSKNIKHFLFFSRCLRKPPGTLGTPGPCGPSVGISRRQ